MLSRGQTRSNHPVCVPTLGGPSTRRRVRRGVVSVALLGSLTLLSASAGAQKVEDGSASSARPADSTAEGSTPLRLGGGQRKVDPREARKDEPAPPNGLAAQPTLPDSLPEATATRDKPPPTHRRGPAPKRPNAQLPEGVPLPTPKDTARRLVAEGPNADQIAFGPADEQLQILRDAEQALFPKRLRGIETGWSWDLPEPSGRSESIRNLGLPLAPEAEVPHREPTGPDAEWLRSLTMPDLPVRLDRRVVTYLKFYRDSDRGRTIAAIWARKSGRYVAAMKAELKRAGLPTDLAWLSLIESGHDPVIRSPAGAVGLWQFMPSSGRMYGLMVDRWVDERRDPGRATQAAIRFLGDLYQRFGNWELAMAAYNMGYNGLSRAIAKYNTNDYWALSRLEAGIPWETTLYVPKIFAIAIVMNNRQAFGLQSIRPDAPISFDTVLVEPATPLEDVAKAAGVAVQEVKRLNGHLLADRTPPIAPGEEQKRYRVKLPAGTGAKATRALAKERPDDLVVHRTRFGETLEDLARESGVTEAVLRDLNSIDSDERLAQGTVLLVPRGKSPGRPEREVVVVPADLAVGAKSNRVFYRVRTGDELEEIAVAFGVSLRDIASWNALDPAARLRSGMTLQLIVPKTRPLDDVRYIAEDGAQVLVAGSKEFHEHFEGLDGKYRIEVLVRKGDTLHGIGRRYGMSVGMMERVNRRSRHTKLVPGERLVVYTSQKAAGVLGGLSAEPLPDVKAPRPELLPSAGARAER